MDESTIEADYLIMGGGASAMAFADSLLTEGNATMVIVDRHHRPGGHWNDAYPFVRLHQPSSSYGVNSAPLGFGAIDEIGLNIGFEELASGQEVLSHYDRVMRQRFLPSGEPEKADAAAWENFETRQDVCATAYWYQTLPSPRWPALEPYADRIEDLGLPPKP